MEFVGFQSLVCEGRRGRVGKTGCCCSDVEPKLTDFFSSRYFLCAFWASGKFVERLEVEVEAVGSQSFAKMAAAGLPDALLLSCVGIEACDAVAAAGCCVCDSLTTDGDRGGGVVVEACCRCKFKGDKLLWPWTGLGEVAGALWAN